MASRFLGRGKKTNNDKEIKVAIVGAPLVGKSEIKYQSELHVEGEPVVYELLDTSPKEPGELPSPELIQWADVMILVYSVTDRDSFNHVRRIKNVLPGDLIVALIANKADMMHVRQVSFEEGEILAKNFDCSFYEVTASEQVDEIAQGFLEICKETMLARRRSKNNLLTQVLGGRSALRVYNLGKSDSALTKE